MNDARLNEVLDDALPRDWTSEDAAQLRDAVAADAKVREAVAAELHLEQALALRFVPELESAAAFFDRLQQRDADRRRRRFRWAASILLFIAMVGGAGVAAVHFGWIDRLIEWQVARDEEGQAKSPDDKDDTQGDGDGSAAGNDQASAASVAENAADDETNGTAPQTGSSPTDLTDPSDPSDQTDQTDPTADQVATAAVAAADLPAFEPTWRLFDDSAARGDLRWMSRIETLMRPIAGNLQKDQNTGTIHLNGQYKLWPPTADGMAVRLRMNGVSRLNINFENSSEAARVEWHNGSHLQGFTAWDNRADNVRFPDNVADRFRRREIVERLDPVLDFHWDGEVTVSEQTIGPDDFAVRWTGKIIAPRAGTYRFITKSDDGVALSIGGQRLIRNWTNHAPTEDRGEIELDAGQHDIVVEYFDEWGAATLALLWEGPGIKRQVVPAEFLRPAEAKYGEEPGLVGRYCYGPQKTDTQETRFRSVGDDNSRWRSLRQGTLDLRYQDGNVVLARGDVVLLTLPMRSQPTQVTLDAQCQLRLAERLRLPPLSLPAVENDLLAGKSIRPADRQWTVEPKVEYGIVTPADDGSIAVSRIEETQSDLRVATPLNPRGGLTVSFELSGVAPHTGVFFDLPDGNRQHVSVEPLSEDHVVCQGDYDPSGAQRAAQAGLYVGDSFWCRGMFALDHFRVEISTDGQRWAPCFERPYNQNTPLDRPARFGLWASSREGPRTVRLDKIWLSRSGALEGLADEKLVARVPFAVQDRFGNNLDWKLQLEGALDSRPKGVAEVDWRRACFVRLIDSPTNVAARQQLAGDLIDAARKDGAEAERLLAALIELPSRIWISRDASRPYTWDTHLRQFDELAAREFQAGRSDNLPKILRTWYVHDLGLGGRDFFQPMPVAPVGLMRLALFSHWDARRWDELRIAAMQFESFNRLGSGDLPFDANTAALGRLASWMKDQAADFLPNVPDEMVGGERVTTRRWPEHPLVVDSDRESMNTVSEFLAAVETRQYAHACRILTSRRLIDGMVPLEHNGRLAKAIFVLLRETIDRNAELRATLHGDFAGLGELRIREALDNGQFELLEALATQFYGTPAANQAELLLADRDLSIGNFFAAAARYESLIDAAASDFREQIAAKRRLALAMTGQVSGDPVTTTIQLDGQPMSAAEYEKMISDLAAEHHKGGSIQANRLLDRSVAPGPREMRLAPLADVSTAVTPKYPFARRWVAFRFHEDRLVVHRHGFLAVIDVPGKRVLWQKNDSRRDKPYWAGPPARPLVAEGRVIVPFYDDKDIALTCFDLETGNELWKQLPDDDVAGNPVLIDSSLYMIGIRYQRGDYAELFLRRLEPLTGETLIAKSIARLRDSEAIYRIGTPTLVGDALLLRTGGSLVCCDLFGNTRWLRRLSFVPPEVESELFDDQALDEMVVVGNRVILNAPGSAHVCCIDAASGEEFWSHLAPDLHRVVGNAGGRLVICAGNRIEALDVKTGEPLWSTETTADYESVLLGADETIVALTLDRIEKKKDPEGRRIRRIEWLSAANGATVKSCELEATGDECGDAAAVTTDGRVIVALTNFEKNAKSGQVVVLEAK